MVRTESTRLRSRAADEPPVHRFPNPWSGSALAPRWACRSAMGGARAFPPIPPSRGNVSGRARSGGRKDPVLGLPRAAREITAAQTVLEMAATEADWTTPLVSARVGERRGARVAGDRVFHTVVAQVRVTVKAPTAPGAWTASCVPGGLRRGGEPDVIRAQMESGIVYGLTAGDVPARSRSGRRGRTVDTSTTTCRCA